MKEENKSIFWFAAKTRFGQEIKIKRKLEEMGIEHFIPTERKKNYRGRMQEHPVIHNLVFLYASKEQACSLRADFGFPLQYLFDHANHAMLVVPDKQMEDFIRVFDASLNNGGLVNVPLVPGDRIRVIKGPLAGVEGIIQDFQGDVYVGVTLLGMISAHAKVPRAFMEKATSI